VLEIPYRVGEHASPAANPPSRGFLLYAGAMLRLLLLPAGIARTRGPITLAMKAGQIPIHKVLRLKPFISCVAYPLTPASSKSR
jgi:hypothetical protein